jgi:NAD-dependent SIR2 family protein deacetylase
MAEPRMKTVFILGAGASARAGVPMMAEFLDRAEKIFRTKDSPAARDVFSAIAELQGVYAKSFLDLENLESVFGAIEMAQLLGKLAGRSRPSIEELRKNFLSLIVQTIEETTYFPGTLDGEIAVAEPYGGFVGSIAALRAGDPATAMQFALLTFNYDLALDQALTLYQIPFDYALAEQKYRGDLPFLKLHGSINWGQCQTCNAIVPYELQDLEMRSHRPFRPRYALGSNIDRREHCGRVLTGPVLVPPTWNKNDYHGGITPVWERAARELGEADNIIIIGYSLPESDSFFRYLYALGSISATRLKRLWVVNPDESPNFKARFEEMVGRGVRTRLEFLSGPGGKFDNSLDRIFTALQADVGR